MEENIERFERIRSYIKGEMSIEDRIAFERDLLNDEELAQEFEEVEQISKATVRVYEEEQLQKDLEMVEREMAEADKLAKSLRTKDQFFQKVKRWFTPDSYDVAPNADGTTFTFVPRMAITFAVAAALTLGVFLPVNHHNLAMSGYAEAGEILKPENIQFNTLRGDDEISDKLESSIALIQDGKNKEALASLTEVEESIDEQISALSGDDSAVLRIAELNRMKQDAEWYRAVLLMRDKKVGQAKKLLKQIAKSDSAHAEEARKILKEVY